MPSSLHDWGLHRDERISVPRTDYGIRTDDSFTSPPWRRVQLLIYIVSHPKQCSIYSFTL
jgi:hypothetical protein